MASKTMLVLLAIAMVVLPHVVLATDYTVGDDKGWGPDVNYTEWAADKEFFVGDRLVFNYDPNFHNLYNVQSQGPSPQPQSRGTTISAGLAMMIAAFAIAIGVFF